AGTDIVCVDARASGRSATSKGALLLEAQGRRTLTSKQEPRPVVYVDRDSRSGMCSLKVNGYLLQRATPRPTTVRFSSLWRYEPEQKRWRKVTRTGDEAVQVDLAKRDVFGSQTDQVVTILPREVALFWLEWLEDDRPFSALAVSGPVLCNDIDIGDPPEGMIAACVPLGGRAGAMFVPDPKIHCRQ